MARNGILENWCRHLPLLACLALAGCGDDSGGSSAGAPSKIPVDAPAGQQGSPANQPPVIKGRPAPEVIAGTNYNFRPGASDPDGDKLTFTIANKPAWASFDKSNGRLKGSPSIADLGRYQNIRIAASDGKATVKLPAFAIDVVSGGTGGFTLAWNPPLTNTDGSVLQDLAGYRIYLGKQPGNYSTTVEINNPGVTSYVFDHLVPGPYYLVITSIDHSGNESPPSRELSTRI